MPASYYLATYRPIDASLILAVSGIVLLVLYGTKTKKAILSTVEENETLTVTVKQLGAKIDDLKAALPARAALAHHKLAPAALLDELLTPDERKLLAAVQTLVPTIRAECISLITSLAANEAIAPTSTESANDSDIQGVG